MALQPVKTSYAGGYPIFIKVYALFAGGFRLVNTGFNTGVVLPEGSLLKVDEGARTAEMLKSAVLVATGNGTQHVVKSGHHFAVGDIVGVAGKGTAHNITKVQATGVNSLIVTAKAIPNGATGAVLYHATGTGATGTAIAAKVVANALSRYETTIGTTEGVTAARQAIVYKKRIQPHSDLQIANIKFIDFSESY